jgi:hypothetical protein
VEEWFFLYRVALGPGGVSPGNVEFAAAIEADFADSGLAFGDRATVPAGETAEAVVVEYFVEGGIGFAGFFVESGAEGRHGWSYFNAGLAETA